MQLKNSSYGWKVHWDAESKTPFAISNNKVITYDDERSLAEKVNFAIRKNLAGAMVWSLDTDDFHGDCADDASAVTINFPLMRSINKAIENTLRDIEKEKENVIPHGKDEESSSANDRLVQIPVCFLTLVYMLNAYCDIL